MSKKSKIVMWVIIALLVVAVIAVVIVTSLDRGSALNDLTTFEEYIENYSYAEKDDDGVVVDGQNVRLDKDSDGSYETTVPSGQVITRVEINQYSLTGYAASGTVYTLYGASLYGSEALSESGIVRQWMEYGIQIEYANPNSGSYWSSIITIGGLVLLCVVFWLIIRSTAGGAGRTMSFAKSKARISTNIKVRFTDDKVAIYSFSDLEHLVLAYAVSIHKSQGSEFDTVVISVTGNNFMLMTRNLLYTAVTRAKKRVVLVGSREAVAKMVKNNYTAKRFTLLKEFLDEERSL